MASFSIMAGQSNYFEIVNNGNHKIEMMKQRLLSNFLKFINAWGILG